MLGIARLYFLGSDLFTPRLRLIEKMVVPFAFLLVAHTDLIQSRHTLPLLSPIFYVKNTFKFDLILQKKGVISGSDPTSNKLSFPRKLMKT